MKERWAKQNAEHARKEREEALAKEMRSGLASVTGYAMQAENAYRNWREFHQQHCVYECNCKTWKDVHESARQKLYKAQDDFIARFAKETA